LSKEYFGSEYFLNRMSRNNARTKVWQAVAKHIHEITGPVENVLDVGAGYCDFINNFPAPKKWAIDYSEYALSSANPDVTIISGDVLLELENLEDHSLDLVFASNFLEHLKMEDGIKFLKCVISKLKPDGQIILLQPNFRVSYKYYFDDFTHLTIFTEKSLESVLKFSGFAVKEIKGRYLPYSFKSRLSLFASLTYLYLRSPVKPFAGQMLAIAKKPKQNKNWSVK